MPRVIHFRGRPPSGAGQETQINRAGAKKLQDEIIDCMQDSDIAARGRYNHRTSAEVLQRMPGDAKHISDAINEDMQAAAIKSQALQRQEQRRDQPQPHQGPQGIQQHARGHQQPQPRHLPARIGGVVEVRDHPRRPRRQGARSVEVEQERRLTEDDDDDENIEQKHTAEENTAPKDEPDQDQQNREATTRRRRIPQLRRDPLRGCPSSRRTISSGS